VFGLVFCRRGEFMLRDAASAALARARATLRSTCKITLVVRLLFAARDAAVAGSGRDGSGGGTGGLIMRLRVVRNPTKVTAKV
jgi:hypothetical protein